MTTSQEAESSKTWSIPPLVYVAVTLGVILLVRYLFRSRLTLNIPPYPVWPYPVLGHLPYLAQGMRQKIDAWAKSTGDIYSIRMGHYPVVVLSSYDTMYEALVKNAETTSDRSPFFSSNQGESQRGIISSSGHVWKEQRTVSLHILRQFGMGKNILAVKIAEEVSAFLEELRKLSGEATNIQVLLNTAISNVICSIIVGRRYEYGDVYLTKLLHMFDELVRDSGFNSLFTFLPWLKYLPGDLFKAKRRLQRTAAMEKTFCDYYMNKIEEEYDENNLDSFIAAYLFEMKKMERQDKETTLNKENLRRVIFNLFGAGSETTGTTLMWFMLYMLHFPDVQAKIFQEINKVVGTERAPTLQDRPKLNYTNAAILETQRLASIVPLGPPHLCNKDTLVKGYTIPAGTAIMINHDAILLDKDTWENPLDFKPERFLDADSNLNQPKEWTPFSLGRRQCLGESMAKAELFLFVLV